MLRKAVDDLMAIDNEVVAVLDPEKVPDDIIESMELLSLATFADSEIDVKIKSSHQS